MIVNKIKVLQTPNESKCRTYRTERWVYIQSFKRFFHWDYWDVTLEGCLKNAVKG